MLTQCDRDVIVPTCNRLVTRADRCGDSGIRRTHSVPHVCFSQSCQVIDAIPTEHHHVPQALKKKKKKKKIASFGQPTKCVLHSYPINTKQTQHVDPQHSFTIVVVIIAAITVIIIIIIVNVITSTADTVVVVIATVSVVLSQCTIIAEYLFVAAA